MEPLSTSVFEGLIWKFATTIEICICGWFYSGLCPRLPCLPQCPPICCGIILPHLYSLLVEMIWYWSIVPASSIFRASWSSRWAITHSLVDSDSCGHYLVAFRPGLSISTDSFSRTSWALGTLAGCLVHPPEVHVDHSIGLVGTVFVSGPRNLGSVSGWVIPDSKKLYLVPLCLTLSIIRYGSRVKWSNPGLLHLGVVAIKKGAFGLPLTTVINFTFYTIMYTLKKYLFLYITIYAFFFFQVACFEWAYVSSYAQLNYSWKNSIWWLKKIFIFFKIGAQLLQIIHQNKTKILLLNERS